MYQYTSYLGVFCTCVLLYLHRAGQSRAGPHCLLFGLFETKFFACALTLQAGYRGTDPASAKVKANRNVGAGHLDFNVHVSSVGVL